MTRRIDIEPGALGDIREITGFISRRVSPRSGSRRHAGLSAAIRRLADDAEQWG